MSQVVDALVDLDGKQRVRVELDDGATLEGHLNQFDYDPRNRLRVELAVEGERDRYQLRSTYDAGTWAPVRVRAYDASAGAWRSVGAVDAVRSGTSR